MTDRPNILLMDDDVVFRADLAGFLTRNGYDVTSCDTATEAKSLLTEQDFDLVISDIFIREDDELLADGGISLLGWMQTRHDIPKIAMSGVIDKTGIEFLPNMQALGADICLAKPPNEAELLKQIETLLSGDRTTHQDTGDAADTG